LAAALEHERVAAEHLRAVDEMKTIFLQAVSHDLRTPLTTILGIALTLERGGAAGLPADEVTDLLHRLSTNARKLDGLLGDLLDLDQLAHDTLTPRRQVIDLGVLARRVVEDAGVNDKHAVAVDAPTVQIAVDAPKVERIMENLVVNAAKHTAAGTTIWVRVQSQRDGVLLLVEDEGPGVPAQLRERIFQLFHQGRNVADHAPGSGIGLALVAQFASLHGGRAWVQDRPAAARPSECSFLTFTTRTRPRPRRSCPGSEHSPPASRLRASVPAAGSAGRAHAGLTVGDDRGEAPGTLLNKACRFPILVQHCKPIRRDPAGGGAGRGIYRMRRADRGAPGQPEDPIGAPEPAPPARHLSSSSEVLHVTQGGDQEVLAGLRPRLLVTCLACSAYASHPDPAASSEIARDHAPHAARDRRRPATPSRRARAAAGQPAG
jgi:signal transduction histidine kinase